MTQDEMDKATQHLTTKSAKIRALDGMGISRGEIAKFLNIRYQHVRNVLVQPPPARGEQSIRAAHPDALAVTAGEHRPLTIEQAKLGLAAHFGVSPTAIEITIRG